MKSLFLGRQWWAIVAATIGAAAVAAAVSLLVPGTYQAEATLVVTGPSASRELQLTYAALLRSDAYMERAAASLDVAPADLREGLRAIPSPGTTLIGVVVSSSDAGVAVERANAVVDGFGAYLEESRLGQADSVAIVRHATEANRTSAFAANTIVGGVAGLLVASGVIAFLGRRKPVSAPTPVIGSANPVLNQHNNVDPG